MLGRGAHEQARAPEGRRRAGPPLRLAPGSLLPSREDLFIDPTCLYRSKRPPSGLPRAKHAGRGRGLRGPGDHEQRRGRAAGAARDAGEVLCRRFWRAAACAGSVGAAHRAFDRSARRAKLAAFGVAPGRPRPSLPCPARARSSRRMSTCSARTSCWRRLRTRCGARCGARLRGRRD